MKFIKSILSSITIFSVALCFMAPSMRGDLPFKMNYQGKIQVSGSDYTGNKQFQFIIYDDETSGNAVWTSTTPTISVTNGVFSASLSGGDPTLSTATFAGESWLEIWVEDNSVLTKLTPREEIVAAPYAMVAAGITSGAEIPASQIIGDLPAIDGSALTNLPSGSGDNLGNHVATTTLQMGSYAINSSSNITAAYYQINGSTVFAMGGTANLSIGDSAGSPAGGFNLFVGAWAGHENTTGNNNSFVGAVAGRYNTAGKSNSFLGYQTGNSNTTGSYNSFLGTFAGYSNQTGSANVGLGYSAGYGNYEESFSSSTLMGYKAGYALTTGSDNLLLGFQVGDNLKTGSNNIIIGYDLEATDDATSNELNIGNVIKGDLSTGEVTIGKYTTEGINDGKTLTSADFGKTITMDNETQRNFYLPAASGSNIGAQITFVKLGEGTLRVDVSDIDTEMIASDSTNYIYNDTAGEKYASVTLRLVAATKWIILHKEGTWTLSQEVSPPPF